MKKDIKLIIDTRSNKKTTITLVTDGKKSRKSLQINQMHSQAVLPLIEKVLSEQHISLKDITRIEVPVDIGSFTGRRVGVAIAQALGSLLHVAINLHDAAQPINIPYGNDKWK